MDRCFCDALGCRSCLSFHADRGARAQSRPHSCCAPNRTAVAAHGGIARHTGVRGACHAGIARTAGGALTMRQRLNTLADALGVFAALLVLWQLILWIFHIPQYMLPSPWAVARAVDLRFPSLLAALAITAVESGAGLIASIVAGVIVALFFAQSRWVRRMLYPYTILLQTVPIVAIAPLILMWVVAGANGLLVCVGAGGNGAGLQLLFSGDVFGVVLPAPLA